MDNSKQHHRFVELALQESANIDNVLDRNREYKLPDIDSQALLDSCYNFLAYITALGNYYHPLGTRLFNFTIKFHYLLHIGLTGLYTHPRLGSCYQGEDLMKVCKRIVNVSSDGRAPHVAARTALEKFERALSFSM